MLRYAIDANFSQARAERPRFDSPGIWGGVGYGSAVETLALPFGDPGSVPAPVSSKTKTSVVIHSPVAMALALALEVGGFNSPGSCAVFFKHITLNTTENPRLEKAA